MLEAGERRVYQEPTLEALSAKRPPRANRRTAGRTSPVKNRLYVLGAIITLLAFGVYYTSLSAVIASKGYQLEQLKNDISRLEISNERMELTLASMSSLDKVEKIAVEKLGMEKPAGDSPALVAAVAPADSSGNTQGAKASGAAEHQDKNTLAFSNLYRAVAGLFVPGKAQASSNNR